MPQCWCVQILKDKKKGRQLILVHHILSCLSYGWGLVHGQVSAERRASPRLAFSDQQIACAVP